MTRYVGPFHRRQKEGASERPDLRDLAKKLLGYLEQQRKLSGVKTQTIERKTADGSIVRAYFIGDVPMVDIIPAPPTAALRLQTRDVVLQFYTVSNTGSLWKIELEKYTEYRVDASSKPGVKLASKLFTAEKVVDVFDRSGLFTAEYPYNWYAPFSKTSLNENFYYRYVGFSSEFPYEVRRVSLETHTVEAAWTSPLDGEGLYREIDAIAVNKQFNKVYVSADGLDTYDDPTNVGTATGDVFCLDSNTLVETAVIKSYSSGPNTLPSVAAQIRTDLFGHTYIGVDENDAVSTWNDSLFVFSADSNAQLQEIEPSDTHYDYVNNDVRMTEFGGVFENTGKYDYVIDNTPTGYRLTKYSRKFTDNVLTRTVVKQTTFFSTIGRNSFYNDYTRQNIIRDTTIAVSPDGKLIMIRGVITTSGLNTRLVIALHDAETLALKINRTLSVASDTTAKAVLCFSLDSKRVFTVRQAQSPATPAAIISSYDIAKDEYTDVLTTPMYMFDLTTGLPIVTKAKSQN